MSKSEAYAEAMLSGSLRDAVELYRANPASHDSMAEAAKRRHLGQYSQPVREYRNVAVKTAKPKTGEVAG